VDRRDEPDCVGDRNVLLAHIKTNDELLVAAAPEEGAT
jgi:hypothetical protein